MADSTDHDPIYRSVCFRFGVLLTMLNTTRFLTTLSTILVFSIVKKLYLLCLTVFSIISKTPNLKYCER